MSVIKPTFPNPSDFSGTDNRKTIFFRLRGENDIFMWNVESAFGPENFILAQPGEDCRMTTQVLPGYKRLMWSIESNYQDFLFGTTGCLGVNTRLKPLVKFCDE